MTEVLTKEQAFATLMAMVGEVFNRKLKRETAQAYWAALEHLDEAELRRAFGRAIQECKFMPTPAELIELAGRKRNVEAEAALAWQVVRQSIDRYDYTVATIDFGPRVNAVIANLGGWDTLCNAKLTELDNPGWLRKRFDETYQAYADLPVDSLRGEPLRGGLPADWRGGGSHVVVSIAGQPVTKRLSSSGSSEVAALVRELADWRWSPIRETAYDPGGER